MNTVDYLLENRLKRLGCHQPKDFAISQKDKKCTRNFSTRWFEKTPWLTCSTSKKALSCFPCLLFGGDDSAWLQRFETYFA